MKYFIIDALFVSVLSTVFLFSMCMAFTTEPQALNFLAFVFNIFGLACTWNSFGKGLESSKAKRALEREWRELKALEAEVRKEIG